jgi:hypothetical protein
VVGRLHPSVGDVEKMTCETLDDRPGLSCNEFPFCQLRMMLDTRCTAQQTDRSKRKQTSTNDTNRASQTQRFACYFLGERHFSKRGHPLGSLSSGMDFVFLITK